MKPFRDKFTAKFTSAFLAPVEKELGIKLADYASLLQGQVTFALTQNGWEGKPDQKPGFLLLIDTKTNSMLLTTNLATLRKQWVDGGKQIKTSKIRDVEFTTLIFTSDELSKSIGKIFPNSDAAKNDPNANAETLEDPKPKTKTEKIEWLLGQSDSLLIVGSSAKDIEKVMILQSGGPVPPLAGRSPSYTVRQLFDLQQGVRKGPWSALMKSAVEKLTVDDMIAIAAYTASREP